MPIVLKSGILDLLGPSGPAQAVTGIALPLTSSIIIIIINIIIIKISHARYKVLRAAMLMGEIFLYATCQWKCSYRYFKRNYLLPLTSVSSSLRAGPLDFESEGCTIVPKRP